GIENGTIRTAAIDTPEPSPFSHEILNANPYAYLDDAPLEERRARAVQLRSTLRADFTEGAGALDPDAIALVADEARAAVRDPDELHETLLGLVAVPPRDEWSEFFAALAAAGRATTMSVGGRRFWVAAERLELARRAYPGADFIPSIATPPTTR